MPQRSPTIPQAKGDNCRVQERNLERHREKKIDKTSKKKLKKPQQVTGETNGIEIKRGKEFQISRKVVKSIPRPHIKPQRSNQRATLERRGTNTNRSEASPPRHQPPPSAPDHCYLPPRRTFIEAHYHRLILPNQTSLIGQIPLHTIVTEKLPQNPSTTIDYH